MKNKHIPMEYCNDIDDVMFDFNHYGKTVFRPAKKLANRPRSDLINFVEDIDIPELDKGLVIGKTISSATNRTLRVLIIKY